MRPRQEENKVKSPVNVRRPEEADAKVSTKNPDDEM
jgi:hypothetical protein